MVSTRHCSRCNCDLPVNAFTGAEQPYCRHCRAEYQREWKARRRAAHERYLQELAGLNPNPISPLRHPVTTYNGVHSQLGRERGKAVEHQCQHCGQQAETWAYDHQDSDPHTQMRRSGSNNALRLMAYSLDLTRYMPLCRSCHTLLDSRR